MAVDDQGRRGHPAFEDDELRHHFPSRPRLNAGVEMLPMGRDGILFLNTETDIAIQGAGFRQFLDELLPLLDGKANLPSIASALCHWPQARLHELLGSLFFSGLLEDGPESPEDPPATLRFVGRFCDATRFNANRYEAYARLTAARVTVFGPEQAARQIIGDLSQSGVTAAAYNAKKGLSSDTTLCIGVHLQNNAEPLEAFFGAAYESGIDALYAGFGDQAWQLGPFFVPRRSLRYADLRRQGLAMGSAAQPGALALAMLTQHATCLIAAVAPVVLIDRMIRFETGLGRERQSVHCMARISPSRFDARQQGVLTYLTAVAQPPKRFSPPKSYQQHYRRTNMALTVRPQRPMAGTQSVLLPPITDDVDRKTPTVPLLSYVLKFAFGEHAHADDAAGAERGRAALYGSNRPAARRFAPTGGNLRSPEAFVVVREIAGIAPGVYRYHAGRHAMEKLDVPLEPVMRVLEPIRGRRAQAYLATVGDLAKVRAKYGLYALSIVGYDSGIAAQYVRIACRALDVAVKDIPFVDGGMMLSLLGLPQLGTEFAFIEALALGAAAAPADARNPEYFVSCINELGSFKPASPPAREPFDGAVERPESLPVPSGAWLNTAGGVAALSRLFAQRRSVRSFGRRLVARSTFLSLCANARASLSQRVEAVFGTPAPPTNLYLIVGDGVEEISPGVYRTVGQDGDVSLRLECSLDGRHEVERFVNQRDIGRAPVIAVPMIEIGDVVDRFGARGFVLSLAIGGAVVAQTWLDAMRQGLVGVSYGGLIESELRAAAVSLRRQDLALLAFAFGHARDDGDGK